MLKNLEICEANYMFFASQTMINIKQIAQCYSIYLVFAKIKTQCYLASLDLLYLYNFNKVANLNVFTIILQKILSKIAFRVYVKKKNCIVCIIIYTILYEIFIVIFE